MYDRYRTSYDLASLFRGRRNTLDRWGGKNSNHIGIRASALHSVSFLEVVKFKNLTKFPRIVALASLQVGRQTGRQIDR